MILNPSLCVTNGNLLVSFSKKKKEIDGVILKRKIAIILLTQHEVKFERTTYMEMLFILFQSTMQLNP